MRRLTFLAAMIAVAVAGCEVHVDKSPGTSSTIVTPGGTITTTTHNPVDIRGPGLRIQKTPDGSVDINLGRQTGTPALPSTP
jgi:hypothetical protein